MADYNIYLHSVTHNDSPTSPIQLRDDSDLSGVGGEGGSGSGGFGYVRRAAAFLTNPDSAIGQVMSFGTKILPFAIIGAVVGIAKKVTDLYVPYAASASGDYSFQIKYNNFFQNLHNVTHPFSTAIQRQQNLLEIRKQNARNEQEQLLLGGTIYNSRYGRYL